MSSISEFFEVAAFLGGLFVGLPLLIVWLKDRAGFVGGVMRGLVGATSLLFGIVIILWVIYNLIAPTREFKQSAGSYALIPFRLLLPLAMIAFGWSWLRGGGPGIEEEQPRKSEPEFDAAFKTARKRLDEFISSLNGLNHSIALVLVPPYHFPISNDQPIHDIPSNDEPVWVEATAFCDGFFECQSPSYQSPEVEDGAPIPQLKPISGSVPESDVLDWQIVDLHNGNIRGAFTIIAVFRYLERKKRHINRTRKEQCAQLLDYDSFTGQQS